MFAASHTKEHVEAMNWLEVKAYNVFFVFVKCNILTNNGEV